MSQIEIQFRAPGKTIPHTPDADMAAGQPVIRCGGRFVTIAVAACEAGQPGSVYIDGLFEGPKNENEYIGDGDAIWLNRNFADPANYVLTGSAGASRHFAGYAVGDHSVGEDTITFRLAAYMYSPELVDLTSLQLSDGDLPG